jgi:hypothetical protein
MAFTLKRAQAQNGRYRANFREVPAFSSGLIKPDSIVAEIIWEVMAALFSARWNLSRSDWLVIPSDMTHFSAQC